MDTVKSFLLRHFEKLILVIAVVSLLMVAQNFFSAGEVGPLEVENEAHIKKVNKALQSKRSKAVTLEAFKDQFLQYQNDIHDAKDPYFWAVAVRPDQPPATKEDELEKDNPEQGLEVFIRNVFVAVDFVAKEQMGMVSLKWQDNPDNKEICEGYFVYRKKVGGEWGATPLNTQPIKPWEGLEEDDESVENTSALNVLGKFGNLSMQQEKKKIVLKTEEKLHEPVEDVKEKIHQKYRYDDFTVRPSTKYQYKVVTIIKLGGLDGKPVYVEDYPTALVNVPRSVKIFYIGGSTMGAAIEIVKFELQEDSFTGDKTTHVVHKQYYTKKTSLIGANKTGNSEAKVKLANKTTLLVDFNSGYTLVDIVSKTENTTEKYMKPKYDSQGKKTMIESERTVPKKVNYILVSDNETKKEIKKYKMSKKEFKRILNELKGTE